MGRHQETSPGGSAASFPASSPPPQLKFLKLADMHLPGELVLPASVQELGLYECTWATEFMLKHAVAWLTELFKHAVSSGSPPPPLPWPLKLSVHDGSRALFRLPATVTELVVRGDNDILFVDGQLPPLLVQLDLSGADDYNEPLGDLPRTLQVFFCAERHHNHVILSPIFAF
jgi:hypothetical protein